MPSENRSKSLFEKIKKAWRHSRTASAAQSTPLLPVNDQSIGQDTARYEPRVIAAAADHQTTRPSTGSKPADQDPPPVGSQALYLAIPVEPPDRTIPTSPIASSNAPISVFEDLWNTAFEGLEVDEPDLVRSYVKIAREVLGGEPGEATTDLPDETMNQIERQKYMTELVKRGRERVEKASKITTKVGRIADFILASKGIVELTTKAVPQTAPAALPWAGVCLGLEILRNPMQEMNSNLEGIAYVISRMDWYCALTKLVLDKSNVVDGNNFQAVLSQLKKLILELYQDLLLYQMKSIVSYYRNQGTRLLRDLAKLDDWEGNIQQVKNSEAAVRADIEQYSQERAKAYLSKLSEHAYTLTAQLGNIQQDIRSFILDQKNARRETEDSNCRRDLRVVDPQDDMTRIESNKDVLLGDAYRWIFDTPEYKRFIDWETGEPACPQRRVLWLKGHAGTGKTMLMIGLIRELSNRPIALAPGISFFFCQGTNAELRTATAVLRSLIWLLLLQQPHLISHLLPRYKIGGPSLFKDQNSFFALSEVFKSMLQDNLLSPVYLAVDALDECSERRADLITLISTTLSISKNVKWLLSSRPEVDILSELPAAETLIELNTECLNGPVKAYIRHKLNTLNDRRGYNNVVLGDISDIIDRKANNTFLWVALAFKALGKRNGRYAVDIMSEMPSGLSELYEHMMSRIEKSETMEPVDCKKVLKAVFLAFRPLSVSELSTLTGLELGSIQDAVQECGSFFTRTNDIVNLIHQSAKDYLKDKYDSQRDPDWVALEHADLVEHSLVAISSLKWNIYGLEFDTNPKDVTPPDPDPLAGLRYSCMFWMEHLVLSKCEQFNSFQGLMAIVHKFLQTGFLHWLESLSLLQQVRDGSLGLKELVKLVKTEPDMDSGLVEFSKDADLFFSAHISIIQLAPLQTYGSALVFGPVMSLVRQQYWQERRPLVDIRPGLQDHWARHQRLDGYIREVNAVAFSADGRSLASGSRNGEVRLYDTATGAHRQILEGKDDNISISIAFSPCSKTLVIGFAHGLTNGDHIQLWDVETGVYRLTLNGHAGNVHAVAFSPDGSTLASASSDETIRLWNTRSSMPYQTLKGHTSLVTTIAFASNNTLVSGSSDGTMRLWDVATGVLRKTILVETQGSWGLTVASSPDGNTVASAGHAGVVSLWNVADGAPIQTLEGHEDVVNSVVFSPDGKTLASASHDKTIRLWNLASASLSCKIFTGHTSWVHAVAFSPNGKMLASAAMDSTIRLWDIAAPSTSGRTIEEQTVGVAISPSGKILASVSASGLLRLWDVATIRPGSKAFKECCADPSLQSKDGTLDFRHCTFLRDGRMIALAWSEVIQCLDVAATPTTSIILEISNLCDVVFSPDGKILASISRNSTLRDFRVQLWDLTTTPPELRVNQRGKFRGRLMFSPDSKRLLATTTDRAASIWDLTTMSSGSKRTSLETDDQTVSSLGTQFFTSTSKIDAMAQQWVTATGSPFSSDHQRKGNPEYGVSEDGNWITLNGKGLLWLPADYRPGLRGKPAIQGPTVAIATEAGSFFVIEFL